MTPLRVIRTGFGWYEGRDKDPRHDPGLKVDCMACEKPLDAENQPIKTVSFFDGGPRSYFYRIHRACASPAAEAEIESRVI